MENKNKNMALFKIHTARKVFETDSYAQYQAYSVSGVILSGSNYLDVKYIEVLQTNGTYKTEYPRN